MRKILAFSTGFASWMIRVCFMLREPLPHGGHGRLIFRASNFALHVCYNPVPRFRRPEFTVYPARMATGLASPR
jgi:hypothetical protein